MDQEQIRQLLNHETSGGGDFFDVRCFRTIDSTNEEIKRRAAEGAAEGLCIVSEEQTAGKGRLGRKWESPSGEAIYFSFLLRPEIPADKLSVLTLVMGLSVAEAMRDFSGLAVGIKWPNDVVINHRKLCGILTEASISGKLRKPAMGTGSRKVPEPSAADDNIITGGNENGLKDEIAVKQVRAEDETVILADYVVVGTGVNVNNRAFPEELSDKATSLYLETGSDWNREELLAKILTRFYENYRSYQVHGDLEGLRSPYDNLLVSKGCEVRIEDPNGPYRAVSGGIDAEGRLLVTRENGRTEAISAGEVSVRGIYGYI